MTSPCCDLIYGFEIALNLNRKQKRELFDAGITASPQIYTLEDEPEFYILGKKIANTDDAEQTVELDKKIAELTPEKKEEIKSWLFETLIKLGYNIDVNQPLSLKMNSYYG